ncbi:MAG: DUF262 domain-containing protein [Cyanobacteria bacterium J06623_4]
MRNVQHLGQKSLSILITDLQQGRFVIPDFQREFEWSPWDIRDLMRSIFLDYYIGNLLLWKGKKENFETMSCEPVYGYAGSNNDQQYIVLDGQQRLTAIYYAFVAPDVPLPNRVNRAFYYVRIDLLAEEQYDEAFNYAFLGQQWANVFSNLELQFEQHIFPISVIGQGGSKLYRWLDKYQDYWTNKADAAESDSDRDFANRCVENGKVFGESLEGLTVEYQVSYIELDSDIGVDKVCDIFTQINSKGVRLDVFDLLNALLKPKDIQLKQMWRDAAPRLSFAGYDKMNVYILQVMSILRQNYCSPKYLYFLLPEQKKPVRSPDGSRSTEVLIPSAQDFQQYWDEAVTALEKAISLLRHPQEFGVTSAKYLPYVSILPVFAAMQKHVKGIRASQQLQAQKKIRHWYWASIFTNRYSGSVESTSARDFIDIRRWIRDDEAEPPLIRELKERFRNLDLKREIQRGSSIYKGIFNLLVIKGARDWVTGNIPQHDELDDHHIIPASWGARNLAPKAANTILNRTPLDARTNRHMIGDRLPNEYLPELIEKNGESEIGAILESHCISPVAQEILMRKPFTPDDFEAFIAERQRTILMAIESLLIKERLDLPLRLRELDEQVEQVELGLRRLIHTQLEGDASLVPSNVMPKVKERIQQALRKNPTLTPDDFRPLAKKLEYFDLRELQDTMGNKLLWPKFEPYFKKKVDMDSKFGQLAELRNGLRHSRTVTEVARKEGEAAIIWFEQIIAMPINVQSGV